MFSLFAPGAPADQSAEFLIRRVKKSVQLSGKQVGEQQHRAASLNTLAIPPNEARHLGSCDLGFGCCGRAGIEGCT